VKWEWFRFLAAGAKKKKYEEVQNAKSIGVYVKKKNWGLAGASPQHYVSPPLSVVKISLTTVIKNREKTKIKGNYTYTV